MKVVFRRSKTFNATLEAHKEVKDRFVEFIKLKSQDPMAPFGAKDTHFSGEGHLGREKIIHAHLNRDLSLLYKRSGKNPTVIDLIGIFSHQESGTGTPPNLKTQKTLAKKVSDMAFEGK